jgi:hypothetical protein
VNPDLDTERGPERGRAKWRAGLGDAGGGERRTRSFTWQAGDGATAKSSVAVGGYGSEFHPLLLAAQRGKKVED